MVLVHKRKIAAIIALLLILAMLIGVATPFLFIR
jgi:hypothetical protein